MKFIVDEMPKSKSKCPYSEWKPYPPIMEETGHYICKINHNDCNLCETECQFLKREKSETWMEQQEADKKDAEYLPMETVPVTIGNDYRTWLCSACGSKLQYKKELICSKCHRKIDWESR